LGGVIRELPEALPEAVRRIAVLNMRDNPRHEAGLAGKMLAIVSQRSCGSRRKRCHLSLTPMEEALRLRIAEAIR
jgi:hypothetical protein